MTYLDWVINVFATTNVVGLILLITITVFDYIIHHDDNNDH